MLVEERSRCFSNIPPKCPDSLLLHEQTMCLKISFAEKLQVQALWQLSDWVHLRSLVKRSLSQPSNFTPLGDSSMGWYKQKVRKHRSASVSLEELQSHFHPRHHSWFPPQIFPPCSIDSSAFHSRPISLLIQTCMAHCCKLQNLDWILWSEMCGHSLRYLFESVGDHCKQIL